MHRGAGASGASPGPRRSSRPRPMELSQVPPMLGGRYGAAFAGLVRAAAAAATATSGRSGALLLLELVERKREHKHIVVPLKVKQKEAR
ncbi:hypothetical protein U9M48_029244 [Paspalum notatum var. saurae]|uniref:Uncharacterized protein n=1 Tax=Paspalum notatum var. saurae TaxID=547442 RepID=A0AAQ3TYI7_PASNO